MQYNTRTGLNEISQLYTGSGTFIFDGSIYLAKKLLIRML